MRRRDFIAGLGMVAAMPTMPRAQQSGPIRRVGVLMPFAENDTHAKGWMSEFVRGLSELGWINGRTMHIEARWAAGNFGKLATLAKELIGLQPDVILAVTTPPALALHRETQNISLVFVLVAEPIAEGFVDSVRRPGGNMTGFVPHEPTLGGKWLQLLREITPSIKRVAIIFNPDTAPYVGSYYLPSFQEVGRVLNVEPIAAPIRSDAEIETVVQSLAREPRGGLIVGPDSFLVPRISLIALLAARNNVPTIGNDSAQAKAGLLLSYGPPLEHELYRAASYVDRILKGAKPADLPVQYPVKLEMTLNMRTAKLLGLAVPPLTLVRADEVIE